MVLQQVRSNPIDHLLDVLERRLRTDSIDSSRNQRRIPTVTSRDGDHDAFELLLADELSDLGSHAVIEIEVDKDRVEWPTLEENPLRLGHGRGDDDHVIAQELLDDDPREDLVIFDKQDAHVRGNI